MNRTETLDAAKQCVCTDRNLQYGEPESNFKLIAKLWSAYLVTEVKPEDVAAMMVLFKVARIDFSLKPSPDSWVDIAGYAACGCELESEAGYEVP